MREHFFRLADHLRTRLEGSEEFTLWLVAEQSDFVRFNGGKVRQAGRVEQVYLEFKLLLGNKHVSQNLSLSGKDDDFALLDQVVADLRSALGDVPDDPYLLLNRTPRDSERVLADTLPPTADMLNDIVTAAAGCDLVGILAAGPIYHGFANSLGQSNWHQAASWNFDWSLHGPGNQAVKRGSAGTDWSAERLRAEFAHASAELALLARTPRHPMPGSYRAYFTPAAVAELLQVLNLDGFSEKQQRAKRSPLVRLVEGEASLSPLLHLAEDCANGMTPGFQAEGFIKPDRIELITAGRHAGSLVSPRSASEYGITGTAAEGDEAGRSLELAAGTLAQADVLAALGTGLYIANLWYLNFSEQSACRITGMTRFACFWVEQGKIVAPLAVMRFDDTIYRLLGSELEALTREREMLVDPGSYGARACASVCLPGALVKRFNLVS
ncbi:TldE/PmbA family protein [Chitinimonas arctica]|uniref:TldE/PmbA family protein n=1 Tax=Chitinimonas arctica TaxID=2594795 RepID=A0A516SKU8_9NEIS|nr:metallopeptidase TldD-related protein [Chitinimonas arctica]QDQ28780.1 TldE/PmbA family protein [Chitinimonas arctica]